MLLSYDGFDVDRGFYEEDPDNEFDEEYDNVALMQLVQRRAELRVGVRIGASTLEVECHPQHFILRNKLIKNYNYRLKNGLVHWL